jgi:hypothetical protein
MMNDKKLRQVLLALETASQNDAVREARATVLTEIECRKRRDPNPGYLRREFKEKGGIVHDVMTLLERVGRLRADGPWQYKDDVVRRIQRNALLVGSHALRPVLETLNEQHLYWERRDPKVIEAERASIEEMLMEQAREEDTAEVNGSIDPDSTKEN